MNVGRHSWYHPRSMGMLLLSRLLYTSAGCGGSIVARIPPSRAHFASAFASSVTVPRRIPGRTGHELRRCPLSSSRRQATFLRLQDSPHCIFGYGSLMCADSRRRTNPTLADKRATPVVVQHWERVWSARTLSGYTAMGIAPSKLNGGCVTGVVIRDVSDDELLDLDRREAAYDRMPIQLGDIGKIPFLDPNVFYSDEDVLWNAVDRNTSHDVQVWVYVQKEALWADESHPILQSYVDIILRGCLEVSTEFAQSFIATTQGWRAPDEVESRSTWTPHRWVDDRACPLYPRADATYSLANARLIDDLLHSERDSLRLARDRTVYDPMRHLAALVEAQQNGLASPVAVERVVQRLQGQATNGSPLQ